MPTMKAGTKGGAAGNSTAVIDSEPVVVPGAGRPTLRDVVVHEMITGRNPDRPIMSRLVIVGEISSKDDPPRQFFEDVVITAQKQTNEQDPLGGRMNPDATETVFIGGVFVEMQQHFFLLLESEPQHLLNVAIELHRRVVQRKVYDSVKGIHIAMAVDDVGQRAFPKYCSIDANLASGSLPKKKFEEMIVDAVHGLLQLGKQLQSQGRIQMDNFLAGVKNSNPQLLPRSNLVEKCIDSGLCFTLDEYVSVYSEVPLVVRPSEATYPLDPPLSYTP